MSLHHEISLSDQQVWHLQVMHIQIRIGEADNPGPDTSEALPSLPGLTLGAVNPTGILRKSVPFSALPSCEHAIWGVCETHLTQPGVR